MANNMTDEQINKIAQAIAAKLAQRAGPVILGCGDASSSQSYTCQTYGCDRYECGGAGKFTCGYPGFMCGDYFWCYSNFECSAGATFICLDRYNP